MRGDGILETTTSIAGTAGNGAVTTAAYTDAAGLRYGRFSDRFGTGNYLVEYTIYDKTTGKREWGIGQVASNVLTRTTPRGTFDGAGTYTVTGNPAPLAFGSTPTTGNVLVTCSPLADSPLASIPYFAANFGGDFAGHGLISGQLLFSQNGTNATLTASREYYIPYYWMGQGEAIALGVMQQDTGAGHLKFKIYQVGDDGTGNKGFPAQDILSGTITLPASSSTFASASIATKLPVGWYYIGIINDNGNSILRYTNGIGLSQGPLPRKDGYGSGSPLSIAGSYAAGLPAGPPHASSAYTYESTGGFGIPLIFIQPRN